MQIDVTTPALLFPAISLLLLAYTNRFLVLAQLIRELSGKSRGDAAEKSLRQIAGLKKRIELIRWMQVFGVVSFLFCTFSMFALFLGYVPAGQIVFGISLAAMCLSLVLSLIEIAISSNALNIELQDIGEGMS
ncbi:MAG TPA: DUF2721 domain-containing protein [Desulfuromonadales bacterium]|nr:DUF2721 domain-containing protein [Desulfuromonadales bacterium]